MSKTGLVVVVVLAVVGLGAANRSFGGDAGPKLLPTSDMSMAAERARPIDLSPQATSASEIAPQGPQAPTPSTVAVVAPRTPPPASSEITTTASPALLDPALLPSLTNGVRVLTTLPTKRKVVALTFDVELGPEPARRILDTLKAEGVRASFGLTGIFALGNADVVQRMSREGHDIFNHTYSHPSLPALGPAHRRGQLRLMEEAVVGILARKPVAVFRPPYGNHNPAVLQDIAAMGYRWVLMWDVDPQGFRGFAPAYIAGAALRQAKAGSIILLHGIPPDAAALPSLIRGLKERGFGFVTVSEALGLK